jgi:hypothetical protein
VKLIVVEAEPLNDVPPVFNNVKLGFDPGVAHLSPVASELSATKSAILREQSQRIVLGT